MISQEEATQIATTWLQSTEDAEEFFVLLVEQTEAYLGGWIFFYQSATYLRTQEISYAFGNASIVACDGHGSPPVLLFTRVRAEAYVTLL